MPQDTQERDIRELAYRRSAGIEVWLYWDPVTDEVLVHVTDERTNHDFALLPAKEDALYTYLHPFAVLRTGGPGGPAEVVGAAPRSDAA
jgi:hypothetical protein